MRRTEVGVRGHLLRAGVCAALAAAGVLVSAEARAQPKPPGGDAVLDRYVAAIGGRDAYAKFNNRLIKARLEVPAAGLSMTVTNWNARPDKARTLVESDVVGRIERGFDGAVGWEISITQGPRILDGVQLDNAARESRFDGLVAWREWVVSAENQGAADVDGKPAWKILVTPKRGTPQTCFFEQATSLLVKIEMVVPTVTGDVPTETFVGDYREVSGVRLPHRTRQRVGGQELVTVFESVTYNAEFPAGQFDLPKEIQALLASRRK
jgi:zinc protease